MHTSATLAALVLAASTVLADHTLNMPKQNHASFVRVKRGGATLHLIGDETVAKWSGNSAPQPPAITSSVATSSTSTMNLLDSINAVLGAPVGGQTASVTKSGTPGDGTAAVSSSSTISTSTKATSSSSSSSKSSSSKSSSASVSVRAGLGSSVAASSTVSTSTSSSTSSSVTRSATTKASKAERKAARALQNSTVADLNIDREHALGRRAARNVTSTIVSSASASTSTLAAATDSVAATLNSLTETISTTNPQGWGAPFADKYTTMSVINHAVQSGSSRIFSRDLWETVLGSIKSGDVVLFELGHYDNKIPGSVADKAAGCPGSVPGWDTGAVSVTGCSGVAEEVENFGNYVIAMCTEAKAKGASCVISSLTPKNEWKRGDTVTYNTVYTTYAQRVASSLGVPYIDHASTSTTALNKVGQTTASSFFMSGDTMQTNSRGAEAFAAAFAAAAHCAGADAITSSFTSKGNALKNTLC